MSDLVRMSSISESLLGLTFGQILAANHLVCFNVYWAED